ncbi:MAG: Hsp20/alpha crystallin family protein [Desulfovibrionaceae bacterium]
MVLDFNTFYRFPGGFDRLFEDMLKTPYPGSGRLAYPPLNLSQDQDAVYVRCEVPGLGLEDVELTLTDKSLVIRGERKAEEGRYLRQERPAGSFQRVVRLNVPVDRNKVAATLKDGVLTITLPNAEEARPKKISIDVA